MTVPTGVFIALGILAYIILWRYIFLQFFKLVKPCEDYQDSLHEAEPNFFDDFFSSQKDHRELCQTVSKSIKPEKQSVVLSYKLFSICVFEKVEHFDKILAAHKPLKLCLRSRIGRCGKSMVTEKVESRIPRLQDMQVVADDTKDTQILGNPMLKDIAGGFDTFEIVKCHTTPPDIKSNVQLGREKKDLDTMIRRLVAAELMKCCEKEHGAMSRAHSDTNNRVNWKRNKYRKQAVNLDANSPSLVESHQASKESICDTSPESATTFSSLPKKYGDFTGKRIENDVTPKFVTEKVFEVDHSCHSKDEDDACSDKGCVESITIVENDFSISCKGGCRMKKPSETKNAVSVEEPEAQTIRTTTTDTTLQVIEVVGKIEDAATQTEHMYMIRAVRSCPGRRRRLQLLGTPRGMSKARNAGKVVPMEIFLPGFIHRKASDNLIYEMGKGSRSPSYIPVPERFRWRYLTPTKVKVN